MGDLVFITIWFGLLAMIFGLNRMSRYYHREAMYWHMHIRLAALMDQAMAEHPEYEQAYSHLVSELKTEADLHLIERESMSGWDKLKDGGRLPA